MSAWLIAMMLFATTAEAVPFFPRLFGRRADDDRRGVVVRQDDQRKLKRQRVRGTVERVSGQIAYIRTRDRVVAVRLGPAAYWEAHGYRLVPGSRVSVLGWTDPYDDDDLFFAASINGPGFSFDLTNRRGVPLWVSEYEYARGWHPTYDTYEVWYRPTYYAVPYDRDRIIIVDEPVREYGMPPGHTKGPPPGHVKGAPPGHTKGSPPGHVKKRRAPDREQRGEPERRRENDGYSGPRGK